MAGEDGLFGWGSLVRDQRNLPVQGVWHHDGPALPIEFARESGDGRELQCDDDKANFESKLAQLAKSKPATKPISGR